MIIAPGRSIRLRLFTAGLVLLAAVFGIAFFGLSVLFERHVERRVALELTAQLDRIVAALEADGKGGIRLARQPTDPRYQRPMSGYYWQVEAGNALLRSRSLWESRLELAPLDPGRPVTRQIAGPGASVLFSVMREVIGGHRLGDKPMLAAVAVDRVEIERATADFRADMTPYFVLFALLLVSANLLQIQFGLRPLAAMVLRVARIRAGAASRMGQSYPAEILPLATEIDALLDAGDSRIKRARHQASDIAHGLKTPLQAIAGDLERLKADGRADVARDIGLSLDAMRRHIDHQLARARIADRSQPASSHVLAVAMRVLAVVERTPKGQLLSWDIDVPETASVFLEAEDLAEILGNLLENAARYARSTVGLSARIDGDSCEITVRDDGPGIPDDQLQTVLKRGERLDRSSGGAGLGLAIVGEIIDISGGAIHMGNAGGGLNVVIRLKGGHR